MGASESLALLRSSNFWYSMKLIKIDEHIWIFNGSIVSFYGLPYSTRMTVVQLNNDRLWIHSPEKLNEDLRTELDGLGKVEYLISPNKLHHLFLSEWISTYPNAK